MEAIMELDDFKSAWQALDKKLAQQNALKLAELRDRKLGDARRSLRPLAWGQMATIAFGILMILLGVGAWTSHRDGGIVFFSGLIIHAYGVLVIIAGASTLARIGSIDYSAPVLTIQQQLSRLRRWYVGWGAAIGLPWWLLWLPFLVCLSGKDVTQVPWLVEISGTIGVVGLLATGWFHRWLQRPGREKLRRSMDDGAAGRSLVRAASVLDEIARYEKTD